VEFLQNVVLVCWGEEIFDPLKISPHFKCHSIGDLPGPFPYFPEPQYGRFEILRPNSGHVG